VFAEFTAILASLRRHFAVFGKIGFPMIKPLQTRSISRVSSVFMASEDARRKKKYFAKEGDFHCLAGPQGVRSRPGGGLEAGVGAVGSGLRGACPRQPLHR
jgi:hypothetical protein